MFSKRRHDLGVLTSQILSENLGGTAGRRPRSQARRALVLPFHPHEMQPLPDPLDALGEAAVVVLDEGAGFVADNFGQVRFHVVVVVEAQGHGHAGDGIVAGCSGPPVSCRRRRPSDRRCLFGRALQRVPVFRDFADRHLSGSLRGGTL